MTEIIAEMIAKNELTHSEFILGGQKSGKSRRAELLAQDWLLQSPDHKAVLIATAQPWDEEMRQRIARHQHDRSERVPRMLTVEEPLQLAQSIAKLSQPDTLLVVDCLTLWLTNLLMPAESLKKKQELALAGDLIVNIAMLLVAITDRKGPIVIVSNEIGLGVIPMGQEVRSFVDALGRLNQDVAQVCDKVTLMAVGLPLSLK
jgi:adenosylcobinamide kinase / adenosylcobinamide-phosphate guanylyltransferase